jgi:hypothetical protein
MEKVLITNYRGFDIEFDIYHEKFQCIITDELVKESLSFTAVRKFIDDYKKENQVFKPFDVEPISTEYRAAHLPDKLTILGIRKDGRFIAEDKNGKKIQLGDYDMKQWMLVKPENDEPNRLLKELKVKEDSQNREIKAERKAILETLTVVSLKDYKETIL